MPLSERAQPPVGSAVRWRTHLTDLGPPAPGEIEEQDILPAPDPALPGKIKNGKVLLDNPKALPDGTEVATRLAPRKASLVRARSVARAWQSAQLSR